MSAKTQIAYRGTSFAGLLTLIFVAARLWDKIDWSWIWVCSPLWIEVGVVLALAVGCLVVAGAAFAIAGIVDGVSRGVKKAKGHSL